MSANYCKHFSSTGYTLRVSSTGRCEVAAPLEKFITRLPCGTSLGYLCRALLADLSLNCQFHYITKHYLHRFWIFLNLNIERELELPNILRICQLFLLIKEMFLNELHSSSSPCLSTVNFWIPPISIFLLNGIFKLFLSLLDRSIA